MTAVDPTIHTEETDFTVYLKAKSLAHNLPPIGRATRPYWVRVESRILRMRGLRAAHLLHIGKTGGNSVRHALDGVQSDMYAVRKWGHGFHLRHVPKGDKYFFFVRDPVSRFTSAFTYRFAGGTPLNPDPWTAAERRAFELFPTPTQLGEALSAGGEDQKNAEEAMNSIEHVRDHFWDWFEGPDYFLTRRKDLLFVGRQGHMTEDFLELTRRLGIKNRKLPADEVSSNRTPETVSRVLSDLAHANLTEWYRADYQFLQFLKDHGLLPA